MHAEIYRRTVKKICTSKINMLQKLFKQRLNNIIASPNTKLALIVRIDIKMSKGKTAAQCAHAAVNCYQQAQMGNEIQKKMLKIWCAQGQPKIVLKVENYANLEIIQYQAHKNEIVTSMIRDAGHTQVAAGTVTVLGVGPDTTQKIDEIVSHLKLL